MKFNIALTALWFLLFPVLAFAGHTAFDNMTELDEELADLKGQVGIVIEGSIELVDGYVAWRDHDGIGTDGNIGVVLLDDLRINGGGGIGSMEIKGLTIDADTNASGVTSLIIQLPKITGEFTIGNLSLGESVDDARTRSLGSLSITNMDLSSGTMQISPH
ncbi:MAG: hypothetical protein JEZ02_19100 [Desulfatibacillum sp.]|nr:hypothetical protein [Desulfatibacillum sp.]